jgi:hypothetical protein
VAHPLTTTKDLKLRYDFTILEIVRFSDDELIGVKIYKK